MIFIKRLLVAIPFGAICVCFQHYGDQVLGVTKTVMNVIAYLFLVAGIIIALKLFKKEQ
jgi:hypothetical protein